jgi:hypothetical protein
MSAMEGGAAGHVDGHAIEAATNLPPTNVVRVHLLDARPPCPVLAEYVLVSVPRPGDLIKVMIGNNRFAVYKIEFVNFDPFNKVQIALGCTVSDNTGHELDDNKMKERMDAAVKSQIQIFDRAQAYSNAIVVAGYAGIFGVWTFTKGTLTPHATDLIAILIGVSLLLYISWEIYSMVIRAVTANRYFKLISKSPMEYFKLAAEYEADARSVSAHTMVIWKSILFPTIGTAYLGALLLLYNAAARMLGLPQWP